MPFEKFEDAEAINSDGRNAIARSIRIISVEELKKLGQEIGRASCRERVYSGV